MRTRRKPPYDAATIWAFAPPPDEGEPPEPLKMRDILAGIVKQVTCQPARQQKNVDPLSMVPPGAAGIYHDITKRLKPKTAAEHRMIVLAATAVATGLLTELAVRDAAVAVEVIKPRSPGAYFRTVVNENARKAGVDPSRIWNATVKR